MDWVMIMVTTLSCLSMMFETPTYRVMENFVLQVTNIPYSLNIKLIDKKDKNIFNNNFKYLHILTKVTVFLDCRVRICYFHELRTGVENSGGWTVLYT